MAYQKMNYVGKQLQRLVHPQQKHINYLTDNKHQDKTPKGRKKQKKKKILFEDYESFLKITELENRINHLEKTKLKDIVFKNIIKNL